MTPDDWQTATIGELGSVVTGGTPSRRRSDFWGGNIPWMSSGEIHQRRVTNTRETITDAGFDASNVRWIPKGAVLVALNGQGKTRGTAAILARRMTCNQSLAAIISRQDVLVADYLFHYLSEKYVEIRRLTGDGGRNGLNLKHVSSIRVAYPPLPEQRKIATILSSVDDAIEKTQEVIDQVQVVKRGLMQELLTRGLPGRHTRFKQTEIGEIPAEWKVVQLSDLTMKITDGVHKTPHYLSRGVPFLSVNNLRHGCIDFADCKFVSEETHQELAKRCCPEPGDLLMGKVATLGVVDVVQTTRPFSIFVQLALIRPRAEVLSRFLKWAIRDEGCQRRIAKSSSGTGMKYIGIGQISRLLVPLPSGDEQESIASRLDALEARVDAETASKECLLGLKASLMSVLLTGELRVTPYPETA